ncbi:putative RNA methylase [Pyrodictium delaneyi]|uniref:Putative RNA methylase n=1 Tax=Pyrodictium delaneyi TaxID=1273541 RepID=A0A0P0N3C7_9CREN|nr:methyltransferase [Pyrodictium delaneyi]ALL00570.1 putative RNA methylase [Pyrodictium delaneyi]OWJ54030.1 hypothetical protein Pdsh_09170 [Pyrodictium delaneyi]
MRLARISRLRMVLERLVPRLESPKRELEQYRTPPEIAVDIAMCIAGVACKVVVDLGSGTGMLSYAVSLVSGSYVVGFDVDEALAVLARSSDLYEASIVDFVVADVAYLPLRPLGNVCVVQNPPFGVSRRGADRVFMKAAMGIGARVICSLHYASVGVERYLKRLFSEAEYIVEFMKVYRFPLPAMYRDHVKRIHYIPVLLLRAWRGEERGRQRGDAKKCRGAGRA